MSPKKTNTSRKHMKNTHIHNNRFNEAAGFVCVCAVMFWRLLIVHDRFVSVIKVLRMNVLNTYLWFDCIVRAPAMEAWGRREKKRKRLQLSLA